MQQFLLFGSVAVLIFFGLVVAGLVNAAVGHTAEQRRAEALRVRLNEVINDHTE